MGSGHLALPFAVPTRHFSAGTVRWTSARVCVGGGGGPSGHQYTHSLSSLSEPKAWDGTGVPGQADLLNPSQGAVTRTRQAMSIVPCEVRPHPAGSDHQRTLHAKRSSQQ